MVPRRFLTPFSINLTQDGSNVAPVAPFLQPSICGGGVVTDHDDQGKKGRRKRRIRREGAGKARLAVLALQQVHTYWWDVGIVVEENSGSISNLPLKPIPTNIIRWPCKSRRRHRKSWPCLMTSSSSLNRKRTTRLLRVPASFERHSSSPGGASKPDNRNKAGRSTLFSLFPCFPLSKTQKWWKKGVEQ